VLDDGGIIRRLVLGGAMFSDRIGGLLKQARQQLNVSREELARRGGVSARLVAELERGQRPNVSLESALKLLNAVGVSVVATAPNGIAAEIRSASDPATERAARAMRRRQTWTGRHVPLHREDDEPQPVRSKAKRLSAVAQVSKQAYLIASAKRERGGRPARKSSGR
jgi:transcriptional regulator with XRE-family HTH domain